MNHKRSPFGGLCDVRSRLIFLKDKIHHKDTKDTEENLSVCLCVSVVFLSPIPKQTIQHQPTPTKLEQTEKQTPQMKFT